MNKDPIIWEALEYDHIERTIDWYWAVIIIAGSVAIISVILGNIIFAIVIAVSTFALIVGAKRKPKIVRFEINRLGLRIDEDYLPYGNLRSFWVEDNAHFDAPSRLFFRARSFTAPIIHIPIESVEPNHVRDFLLDMLLEEEHTESLLHRFFRYLGF